MDLIAAVKVLLLMPEKYLQDRHSESHSDEMDALLVASYLPT
jgi:hypothetical protein